MERVTISWITESNSKRCRRETEGINHEQAPFSDPPKDILVNILLRLTIKTIFVCKSVCKTWYNLVSDPEFAKLHFDQSEVCPLIQTNTYCTSCGLRMVHLVEQDKDDFEHKLGMCDHTFFKPGCVCNVKVRLDTKFEIPWRTESCFSLYDIVNSCNGFLCLFDNDHDSDPPIVCNPITGEFINLPVREPKNHWVRDIHYGFGFSPASNQYKVIRMFKSGVLKNMMCFEVHVLGTETWKYKGRLTQSMPGLSPIYLNGFLYWSSGKSPLPIVSFDIERECFGSISTPVLDKLPHKSFYGVGELGGELCICGSFKSGTIHVWVMKDYGTEKAWSEVFSFNLNCFGKRYYGPFKPIKYLNDGALLMFYSSTNALVYMDQKTNRMRFLKLRQIESLIAHIPSFISLKHALSGQNVKVLYVNSRCAELKLHGEAEDIDLVEQEFHSGL